MNKNKTAKGPNHRSPPGLKGMIRHIKPAATWKRLSCSQRTLSELKTICSDFTRGKGLMCLFSGESGTGKTMAAEVIAKELNLDLYRIDLSAVVNKYIGETEKNLQSIFDKAESNGMILLLDEADALFGKRSEVKDSHDRYANIEINYLLQRMEAFQGLSILATRMKHTLDTAYVRRFRYIVNFPDQ